MNRPSITSPCVADRDHGPGQRIAEFTFPDGTGGLIAFSTDALGRNVVELYRCDGGIVVKVPGKHTNREASSAVLVTSK